MYCKHIGVLAQCLYSLMHAFTLKTNSTNTNMSRIWTSRMKNCVMTWEIMTSVTLTPATQVRSIRPSFLSCINTTAVRPMDIPRAVLEQGRERRQRRWGYIITAKMSKEDVRTLWWYRVPWSLWMRDPFCHKQEAGESASFENSMTHTMSSCTSCMQRHVPSGS